MKIKLACPTCRKKFDTLPNLNKHIGKTGCNNSEIITPKDFMKSIGISIKYQTP